MVASVQEVLSDPHYVNAPIEAKVQIQERYWNNAVVSDPNFPKDATQQAALRERFNAAWQLPIPEPSQAPDMGAQQKLQALLNEEDAAVRLAQETMSTPATPPQQPAINASVATQTKPMPVIARAVTEQRVTPLKFAQNLAGATGSAIGGLIQGIPSFLQALPGQVWSGMTKEAQAVQEEGSFRNNIGDASALLSGLALGARDIAQGAYNLPGDVYNTGMGRQVVQPTRWQLPFEQQMVSAVDKRPIMGFVGHDVLPFAAGGALAKAGKLSPTLVDAALAGAMDPQRSGHPTMQAPDRFANRVAMTASVGATAGVGELMLKAMRPAAKAKLAAELVKKTQDLEKKAATGNVKARTDLDLTNQQLQTVLDSMFKAEKPTLQARVENVSEGIQKPQQEVFEQKTLFDTKEVEKGASEVKLAASQDGMQVGEKQLGLFDEPATTKPTIDADTKTILDELTQPTETGIQAKPLVDGKKERKFSQTMRKDSNPGTTYFKDGVYSTYDEVTNKTTVAGAMEYAQQHGDAMAISRVMVEAANSKGKGLTAETSALAMIQMNRLFAEGTTEALDLAIEIGRTVSQAATDSGRAIQILSLWNKLTPEGVVRAAVKLVDEKLGKLPAVQQLKRDIDKLQKLQAKGAKEVVQGEMQSKAPRMKRATVKKKAVEIANSAEWKALTKDLGIDPKFLCNV